MPLMMKTDLHMIYLQLNNQLYTKIIKKVHYFWFGFNSDDNIILVNLMPLFCLLKLHYMFTFHTVHGLNYSSLDIVHIHCFISKLTRHLSVATPFLTIAP